MSKVRKSTRRSNAGGPQRANGSLATALASMRSRRLSMRLMEGQRGWRKWESGRKGSTYNTRAATPCAASIFTAFASNDTNVSAPSH